MRVRSPPRCGVVRQQRAQLPLGEGLQPGVVAQQVEQAAQAQVGQAVEGPAVRLADRHVGHLLGLQEAAPYVADGLDHGAGGQHERGAGLPRRAQALGERGQRAARGWCAGGSGSRTPTRSWSSAPTRAGSRASRQAAAVASASSPSSACPSSAWSAAVGGADDDADQLAAGERHADRSGAGGGLVGVGVGVGEDAGDDRAVCLALQGLLVPLQQAAEGERGRGALGQHQVAGRGLGVAEQDQPAPVLTAGADGGDQPAGGGVVGGALRRGHRAATWSPSRPAACRCRGRPTRRPAPGGRGSPAAPGGRTAWTPGPAPRPVTAPSTDSSVNTSCSCSEARSSSSWMSMIRACTASVICTNGVSRVEHDQRQAVLLGGLDHLGGQLADEPAAQLDDQPGGADGGELGDVVGELARVVGQGDARGEHQLAAAQQLRDVGDLADVHPPHLGVEPVRARDDARATPANGFQNEDVGDGGQHRGEPIRSFCKNGARPTDRVQADHFKRSSSRYSRRGRLVAELARAGSCRRSSWAARRTPACAAA